MPIDCFIPLDFVLDGDAALSKGIFIEIGFKSKICILIVTNFYYDFIYLILFIY